METDEEKRKRIKLSRGVPSYDRWEHPYRDGDDERGMDREHRHPRAVNEQVIEWIRRLEFEMKKLRWPR